MAKIEGGFTLWARQTIDSEIFYYKPDKWFKIWFYLVSKVSHKNNRLFKRGEGLVTYEDIAYKTKATKTQIEKCLKWLRREGMLDERRTTRGNIKIVSKYDTFQDMKTYQKNGETNDKTIERRIEDEQKAVPINKNDKNVKNVKTNTSDLKVAGVEDLMNIFYKINPTLNWGNKTTRVACEFMIRKFGLAGTLSMASAIVGCQGKTYAPVATTPYQMKEKLAQFKMYFDKERNNKPKIIKV